MNIGDRDLKNEAKRAALLAIAARDEGRLHPQAIVDEAEDARSPLHDEFEWDDGEAAAAYRLAQAGALVRRLKVTIIREDKTARVLKVTTTREYESRRSQRGGGGYESLEEIMREPEKRAEMISQVLDEMMAYRRRYEALVELAEIWAAIDEARVVLHIDKKSGRRKGLDEDQHPPS